MCLPVILSQLFLKEKKFFFRGTFCIYWDNLLAFLTWCVNFLFFFIFFITQWKKFFIIVDLRYSVIFCCTTKEPSHTSIHTLFLILSFIMFYLKWLDIVLGAIQQDLSALFKFLSWHWFKSTLSIYLLDYNLHFKRLCLLIFGLSPQSKCRIVQG